MESRVSVLIRSGGRRWGPALGMAFAVFLCQGCIAYYVQNSRVVGPVEQNIPNLTESGAGPRLRMRPILRYNPKPSLDFNDGMHSPVDSNGNYSVTPFYDSLMLAGYWESDYNNRKFQGDNVNWEYERLDVGLELNFLATSTLALEYGLQVAWIQDEFYWSHALGWGWGSTVAGRWGIRADIHANLYQQRFEADMVKTTDSSFFSGDSTLVLFYTKAGKRLYMGSGLQFTANTLFAYPSPNFFLTLEIGTLKYFANSGIYTGAILGIQKDLSKRIRWFGGVRLRSLEKWEYHAGFNPGLFTGLDYGVDL